MKEETLEEAAENYANQITENDEFYKLYEAFKAGDKWNQEQDKKLYTEQEVKYLLEIQRGNCYVALLSHTKNDDIASVALGAPEPGGKNGTWIK